MRVTARLKKKARSGLLDHQDEFDAMKRFR